MSVNQENPTYTLEEQRKVVHGVMEICAQVRNGVRSAKTSVINDQDEKEIIRLSKEEALEMLFGEVEERIGEHFDIM